MQARYYLTCADNRCRGVFQTVPIRSPGGVCARRDTVEPIGEPLESYLSDLIVAARPAPSGIYELRFDYHWWRFHGSSTLQDFEKNLRENYSWAFARQNPANLPHAAVADSLDRYTGRKWIAQLPSGTSADRLKQEILDKAHADHVRGMLRVAACWGLMIALAGSLIYSMRVFFVGLRSPQGRTRKRKLIIPWLWQAAVFVGAFVGSFFMFLIFDCGEVILLAPAVLTAWLTQGWWVFHHRRALREPTPQQ